MTETMSQHVLPLMVIFTSVTFGLVPASLYLILIAITMWCWDGLDPVQAASRVGVVYLSAWVTFDHVFEADFNSKWLIPMSIAKMVVIGAFLAIVVVYW